MSDIDSTADSLAEGAQQDAIDAAVAAGDMARAAVSWGSPGEPIVLEVDGPDGEVAVPLTPTRALALAVDLTQRAVLTIKVNRWGPGWPG